uniref:NADH dehydrogenase subunit 6 n=1 Tax=Eurytoma sp. TJS-2016 TaxID=1855182 RepID=A0A1X9HYE1_9HYME|nr:NADH dehydrogenase subunit 6 [Eurytoma sp. TJS-2016]
MMKILNIQMSMMFLTSIFMMLMYSFISHYNKMHPLIMISILLMILISSSLNLSIYMNNHWFSYIMFLIIVGGMMVIFLYFISFINNMKTSIKWKFLKNLPQKLLMTLLSIMYLYHSFNLNTWSLKFNEISSIYKMSNYNDNLTMMYLYPKNFSTMMSMIYLLISLTIIVKICLNKKIMLRKFN